MVSSRGNWGLATSPKLTTLVRGGGVASRGRSSISSSIRDFSSGSISRSSSSASSNSGTNWTLLSPQPTPPRCRFSMSRCSSSSTRTIFRLPLRFDRSITSMPAMDFLRRTGTSWSWPLDCATSWVVVFVTNERMFLVPVIASADCLAANDVFFLRKKLKHALIIFVFNCYIPTSLHFRHDGIITLCHFINKSLSVPNKTSCS